MVNGLQGLGDDELNPSDSALSRLAVLAAVIAYVWKAPTAAPRLCLG
jgi:hypothetical protein